MQSIGPVRMRSWAKLWITSPQRALHLGAALLRPARRTDGRCIYINVHPASHQGPHVFVRKLAAGLKERDIDVSYSTLRGCPAALLITSSGGDLVHRILRRAGARTVLRVDGFFVPAYFDNRDQPPLCQSRRLSYDFMLLNQQLQRDLLLSDHVIYQSRFAKHMCDSYLFHRRANFSIIPNGVDTRVFKPAEATPRPVTLLSAGNLRHEYMLGTVLPIFEALTQLYELRLLIVGPLDDINRQILERVRERDRVAFAERITYVGPVKNEDLPQWLARADILIHPRAGDWSPNIVAEALACGNAVVCPAWGGAAEMIGEGGVAVAAKPWDYSEHFVADMIDATRRVIEDLDDYKCLARKQAMTNLNLERMVDDYVAALGIAA